MFGCVTCTTETSVVDFLKTQQKCCSCTISNNNNSDKPYTVAIDDESIRFYDTSKIFDNCKKVACVRVCMSSFLECAWMKLSVLWKHPTMNAWRGCLSLIARRGTRNRCKFRKKTQAHGFGTPQWRHQPNPKPFQSAIMHACVGFCESISHNYGWINGAILHRWISVLQYTAINIFLRTRFALGNILLL